jgi:dTDP-4-dehydrorhamnose 3,5-epimerase
MKFKETKLAGSYVVELDLHKDERGAFARTFDREVWAEMGCDATNVQCSISINAQAGTLRGMHFQADPHGEDKLVRCTRGAIFDVIIDLRQDSDTYCRWFGVELTQDNGKQLLVPKGFAHGFQTLRDDTEVYYQMSYPFVAGTGSGVRWNDPAFGIEWPAAPGNKRIMSTRDAEYPDFHPSCLPASREL